MKQVFSEKEINMIRSIVKDTLEEEKEKALNPLKMILQVLFMVVSGIATFMIMSSLINLGASKLYKKRLNHKSNRNTKEETVDGY